MKQLFFLVAIGCFAAGATNQSYLFGAAENNTPPAQEAAVTQEELLDEDLALLADIFDDIDDPEPDDQENQGSLWQKLKIFWALPAGIKRQLLMHHIAEHSVAYTGGAVLTLVAIGSIIIVVQKRPQR